MISQVEFAQPSLYQSLTLLAIGQPVLEVEGRVGEDLAAVGAHEALRVERAVHCLQAVLKGGSGLELGHSKLCFSHLKRIKITALIVI